MEGIDEFIKQGLLSRIAGTKRDGFVVYEAESSYRGFMAIHNVSRQAYGDRFVGNSIVGYARDPDAYRLETYWEWMGNSDYRKMFMFREGIPIGYGLLSSTYVTGGAVWNWFEEWEGKLDEETRNAVCKLDTKLMKRNVKKDCYDYFTISNVNDLKTAVERGTEYERIAAAYGMDMLSIYTGSTMWDSLAADGSWKVRKALAQCDLLPDRAIDMLVKDDDWRVRMGLCLSCSATCPWMSNDMSNSRWNAMKTFLDDPCQDVRVSAANVIVHAIPGHCRDSAIARMADMQDEALKTEALLAVMCIKTP